MGGWIRVDVALSPGVAIDAATATAGSPRICGGQHGVAIARPEQKSRETVQKIGRYDINDINDQCISTVYIYIHLFISILYS